MCTAIISVDPSSPVPVLLVGVRDEFVQRAWEPPGRHWPDAPGLVAGRDLRAGGTWLAVDPAAPRVATVLNGRGAMAPEAGRRSRGELPLLAASGGDPGDLDLPAFDPFHLVAASPAEVRLWSWDGREFAGRDLGPGLHMIVNNGLEGEGHRAGHTEDTFMAARLAHFRPLFAEARRPEPDPAAPLERAWEEWLPLVNGAGVPRADHRALLPLLDLRASDAPDAVWGTTSVSLTALTATTARYDFSATPGDPTAWTRIL